MMTREKDILTQRISEVKAMLDDLVDAPHNRDTLKTACQICNLFLADIEIPDNKRSPFITDFLLNKLGVNIRLK